MNKCAPTHPYTNMCTHTHVQMIWLESLSNPFLRYIDIPAVAEIVKRKMNRRVRVCEGGRGRRRGRGGGGEGEEEGKGVERH